MAFTTRFTGVQATKAATFTGFNPGAVIFDPGIFGTGFGFPPVPPLPPPPPAPAPGSAPAPATGPSINLQALLASIPIAQDGQIISSDHHNSLRAAVIGIANQLGVGLQTATTAFTFAPTFNQTNATSPNWSITNFVASRPATGNPDGWLPVQLPNGQRIQSMVVTGKRSGTAPTTFQVNLFRQLITTTPNAGQPTLLITVSLESSASPFQVSRGVVPATAPTGSGLSLITAAAAEEQKLIDTSNYKYFVQAILTGGATDTVAEIDAIQIMCSQ
jgi:hypothetical protein